MPHMCCGGSWWSDEHHLTDDCLWWQLLCVAELLFSISMLFSSLFVMSTFAIEVQDTRTSTCGSKQGDAGGAGSDSLPEAAGK